jgi:alpha-glucosidase
MYAIYEAPIQMVSDTPAAYKNQPSFDFIKAVPSTWDETQVLNGIPGQYVTIARRHGKEWYLGSMTNWDARSLDLPLTFLGNGPYTAEIYQDAEDANQEPTHVSILKKKVNRSTHLKAQLASGGGYAVRLIPSQQ